MLRLTVAATEDAVSLQLPAKSLRFVIVLLFVLSAFSSTCCLYGELVKTSLVWAFLLRVFNALVLGKGDIDSMTNEQVAGTDS